MTISRRTFLKTSSAIAAGLSTSTILKSSTSVSANDKINVALIGCRGMGWSDLMSFLSSPEVQCLALCDIDKSILNSRAKDLSSIQKVKFDLYTDYRRILDRQDIDAVIIATPDHWHCLQFVDSCKAGKDIYVEKPIGNSIAECDIMVDASKKYKQVVQVGQQQRSAKLWKEMIDYLDLGVLGNISRIHVYSNFNYAAIKDIVPDSEVPEGVDFNTWLGPSPTRAFNKQRFHGSWRMFWDYGGGLMTDWGVHLLDMALWSKHSNKMPTNIQAIGSNYRYPDGMHETFDTQSVLYRFDDHILSWENNAGIESGPYGKNYGLIFTGQNGSLVADRNDWQVFPENEKSPVKIVKTDHQEHRNHVINFLDCMKRRDLNTACTIETGSLSAKIAHLGNISARMNGVSLQFDDVNKSFNNREANSYIKPQYRKPWEFPEI
ncbi:MAG: Gfo/Idh/MocA family oxidoreductase [Dysgonamonadaceae bacterium]|jgi:predicted dehydrogenase|nr:Gfo/Idh/MocA family oxidoreductase [Dysgonamonadaceae bacterium]MDD3309904.1 Gfo/Idh/MocA family oxidoreductase [Dysgonamonadaceae bacterium]MDD3901372.1 Gfo/Idh/MocA family oxidoreductase [Dysgonamonadaceae bacterium]MDD4399861.1 Gfo/Idh/MocA family oxidoreductase [Dysgonamonadaceae bacterium]